MSRIYLSPPDVGEKERSFLLDAFESNWIAPLGPHVDAFEHEVARRAGVSYAAATSSGTAALHLALALLGIGPGDEVLVPSFTFVATANAVTYVGGTPVLVDSSESTWTVDPDLVRNELKDRSRKGRLPKALITVDLYGQCADYDLLVESCAEYGLFIVEDAAEAIGATYHSSPAGSFGEAAVFSFNGNKIITTGGGGMLVSNSADLVDRARHLSTQAREPFVHYEHVEAGFNYRLSNLLAALGRAQLLGLDQKIRRRRAINELYRQGLGELPGISFMPHAGYGNPNYWLTCILIDPLEFGSDREHVRLALERVDIESRPTWKPLHLQPLFAQAEVIGGRVCAEIFARGLCLPSGSAMSDDDVERVVEIVSRSART